MKNYYNILGVSETATDSDIVAAYRKLALKYHPDKSPKTADKFREITEAYDNLRDVEKRAILNISLNPPKDPARIRKGTDLSIILKVTANDIAGEVSKTIVTTRHVHCPNCLGTGSFSNKSLIRCYKCGATGIDIVSTVMGPRRFCEVCKGYGYIQDPHCDCKNCKGTGLLNEKIQKTFKLTRDEKNKNGFIFKGSGNYPVGNGVPGDLIVTTQCDKIKSLFDISGKTIKGPLLISPAQAVLGDTVFLDIFNNSTKVIIPPGTKPNAIIEQHNTIWGSKRMTLVLKVCLVIPQDPSEEEKSLYKQLLKWQKGFL